MISKPKQCSGCGEMKVIWKNHEGERYCKQCWSSKSPPKFPKQLKALPKKSAKRAVLDQLYSVSRQQFLSRYPYCQARLKGCTGLSTDVHHKEGRSKKYLDVLSWLSICRPCHQWITDNNRQAIEMGLSKSRINDQDSD